MLIVLDSNIFVNDFRMNGSAFAVLFETLSSLRAKLLIPEIIVDEVMNKYREMLSSTVQQLNKTDVLFYKMTGRQLVQRLSEDDVDQLVSDYKKYFTQKTNQIKAKIEPYPRVSHEDIVKRCLQRRKPFKSDGNGYRDALIWETILNAARKYGTAIVFITDNATDFSDKEGNFFHRDLLIDLDERKIQRDRLLYCRSISNLAQLFLTIDEEFKNTLNRDQHPNLNVRGFTTSTLSKLLNNASVNVHQSRSIDFKTPLYIKELIQVIGASIFEVRRLNDNKIIIFSNAEVILKAQYPISFTSWPLEDNVDVIPVYSNRHMMISFSIVYDERSNKVLSEELGLIIPAEVLGD